jgi:hypothetical protein
LTGGVGLGSDVTLHRKWREEQAESIRKRDEASAQKRKETIAKAERSIDEYYEDYNAKKERQIKENK